MQATSSLVYTLSSDGTYYIIGTGYTDLASIRDAHPTYATLTMTGLDSTWDGGDLFIPLTHNNLPVMGIVPGAFKGLTNITSIYFEDSGEQLGASDSIYRTFTIGDRAFQIQSADSEYDQLKAIRFPNDLYYIGRFNFARRPLLKTINLARCKFLRYICTGAFIGCSGVKNIILPRNSGLIIGDLTSATNSTFTELTSLERIQINTEQPPTLNTGSLSDITSNCTIYVYDENNYRNATNWTSLQCSWESCNLEIGHPALTLSDDGTYYLIGTGYNNLDDLKQSIDLNDDSVGERGSGLDTSLSSDYIYTLIIPEYGDDVSPGYQHLPIKGINPRAFEYISGIYNVIFSETSQIEAIGVGAFKGTNTTHEEYVNFGWVTEFDNYDLLPIEIISQECFESSGLEFITIPEDVREIRDGSFYLDERLTLLSVMFAKPTSAPLVSGSPFNFYADNIPNVYPESNYLDYVDGWSFIDARIYSPTNPAYKYYLDANSIHVWKCNIAYVSSIPITLDGYYVNIISDNVFQNKINATTLTIPERITEIGDEAFADNTSLTEIKFEGITPPQVGTDIFENTNNCPIYVPSEGYNAYKSTLSQYASRIVVKDGKMLISTSNIKSIYVGNSNCKVYYGNTLLYKPEEPVLLGYHIYCLYNGQRYYLRNNGTSSIQTVANQAQATVWQISDLADSASTTIYTTINGANRYLQTSTGSSPTLSLDTTVFNWTPKENISQGTWGFYLEIASGWRTYYYYINFTNAQFKATRGLSTNNIFTSIYVEEVRGYE